MSKTVENLNKLRDLPDVELQQALVRVRDELFRLKLGMHTNQVASTASLSTKRREVAQIMTILRRRELGLENQARRATGRDSGQSDRPAGEAGAAEKPAAKKTKKSKSKKAAE